MGGETSAAFAVSYTSSRVLVLGDTPAARIVAADAVARVGAGIVASLPIATEIDTAIADRDVHVFCVEIASPQADMATLVPLFDRLDGEAARGRTSVVTVPRDLIDLAAARAGHRGVTILCEPGPVDRVAALGMMLAAPSTRLHDISGDPGDTRLRQLSEEVGRIARTLATLSSEHGGRQATRAPTMLDGLLAGRVPDEPGVETATIRAIIRARRLRGQYFDAELFADPAWDILLDLAAARLEQTPVAVSSLCIAAAVPPTTALRWIKTLTDAGLLVRTADARDGRRVFIELSADAANGMFAYLGAVARTGTLLA